MIERILAGTGLAILSTALLLAQSKSDTFEVADVHPSAPGNRQMDGGIIPGGRVQLTGATMVDLISIAFNVDQSNVTGGPDWMAGDRFDIAAKAPAGKNSEEILQGMLKVLIEQRFHLVVHTDKKDMPVFVLTARKGTKLRASTSPGPLSVKPFTDGDPALNNTHRFTSCSMEQLAELLPQMAANFVNHPVVDETHMKGSFDFDLAWMGIGVYRKAKANPDGPPAVGVFDALEKIGLHLEPANRPQPVIVVDLVDRTPTPNAENVTASIPQFPDEFEVAEVHAARPITPPPARPIPARGQIRSENGRFEIRSATLNGLLAQALDIDPKMLTGAPKWMDEEHFDLIAKTAPDLPDDVLNQMILKVLVEHFHLVTHREDQPMPVYVLLPGKGPKFKASTGTARSECKIEQSDQRYFVCANTTMAEFVERLPLVAGAYVYRPMFDMTGLPGAYDFRLYWTPKGQLSQTTASADTASTPIAEATLFEAVEKQLGLKIELQKHTAPVLVIDKVERLPLEK